MRVLVVVMMRLHSGRGRGLNLRWGCSGRRPRSLSRSGRGEVRLLLARVQHDRRRGGSSSGRGRGSVLLHGVHGGGRAGVLEVMLARVVMVMEVGGWREMGQLVVMVRVMRCHCRGAAVVRSHHFRGIGSRGSAKSHSLTHSTARNERWKKTKQRGERDGEGGCQDVKLSFGRHTAKRRVKSKQKCPAYIKMSAKRCHTNNSPALI